MKESSRVFFGMFQVGLTYLNFEKKILEVWFDLGRIWLADYRISSIIVSVSVE